MFSTWCVSLDTSRGRAPAKVMEVQPSARGSGLGRPLGIVNDRESGVCSRFRSQQSSTASSGLFASRQMTVCSAGLTISAASPSAIPLSSNSLLRSALSNPFGAQDSSRNARCVSD
jgi:hypothetical protein